MKKAFRFMSVGVGVALGVAQFFPPARNSGVAEGPHSIVVQHEVPADIQKILRRACYDCHSNRTTYPWYASFQPVGWWLNKHVADGKAELNFSEFAGYSPKRAVRKLQATGDEVRDRAMPLKSYLLMHRAAKLSDAEAARVSAWAEGLADELGDK